MDTGFKRSRIKFVSGNWLLQLPPGSLAKNFSMRIFEERYCQVGTPLAPLGHGHRNPNSSACISHSVQGRHSYCFCTSLQRQRISHAVQGRSTDEDQAGILENMTYSVKTQAGMSWIAQFTFCSQTEPIISMSRTKALNRGKDTSSSAQQKNLTMALRFRILGMTLDIR